MAGGSIGPNGVNVAQHSSNPSGAGEGDMYYNSTDNKLKLYSNGAWLDVTSTPPAVTAVSGNIYPAIATNVTVSGTDFGSAAGTITFIHGSNTYQVATGTPSNNSVTIAVPSSLYNAVSGGNTVGVKFTSSSGSVSNVFNKAVSSLPTGGTIRTYSGNRTHTFTSSGTFAIPSGVTLSTVQYLAVAGAGGGGRDQGGGGGAGGAVAGTWSNGTGNRTITIGGGGSGGNSGGADAGYNGGNTTISGIITCTGGGGAGSYQDTAGRSGGSGGGSGGMSGYPTNSSGGSGTSGQGNNGGASNGGEPGGGGGKNAAGSTNGNGGGGLANNYSTGSDQQYAGGGGGQTGTGTFGGGDGGVSSAGSGSTNSGSGGGGCRNGGSSPGSGGSGIVVIKYAL